MTPDLRKLTRAIDATWPAFKMVDAGPWTLREGMGGGKRVSCASLRAGFDSQIDLPAAEDAMRIMGQVPLFLIRQGDEALDQVLQARGYQVVDPVNIWLAPTYRLTDVKIPPVTAFAIWEPLAIMKEIWADGGIGPSRLSVMERAKGPKTAILGRINDTPGGAAFCAVDDDQGIAMLHAVEVRAEQRGKGMGKWMTRAAAAWAADWGIEWFATLCTQTNTGANALYSSLGMQNVGQHHYRILS